MTVLSVDVNRLQQRAVKWKAAMRDADLGPLIIAADVVELSEKWDSYRAEADGLSCPAWLQSVFGAGRGLSFFERRAEGVERVGEHARRTYHHEALVWLVEQVPNDELTLKRIDAALQKYRAEAGGHTLRPVTVKRLARPILGRAGAQREPKECAGCKERDERIQELEAASSK